MAYVTIPNGWWPWWRRNRVALQAMRHVFDHPCHASRCPHLTPGERIALDAWLAPRIAAIAEGMFHLIPWETDIA